MKNKPPKSQASKALRLYRILRGFPLYLSHGVAWVISLCVYPPKEMMMDDKGVLLPIESGSKPRTEIVAEKGWARDSAKRRKTMTETEICDGCEKIMDAQKVWDDRKMLLDVAKRAYRKHHLGDDSIGWDELSKDLLNALCNAMGEEAFCAWLAEVTNKK